MLDFHMSSKALAANQLAIQTIAHNITNAETPGYTRQVAQLKTAQPKLIPELGYIGQGVGDVEITRKADLFLDQRIEGNLQKLGRLTEEKNGIDKIESLLSPGDGDLISKMDNFLKKLNSLSANPDDMALRNNFVDSSKNLAISFQGYAENYEEVLEEIHSSIKDKIEQVNQIISHIAELNKQIQEFNKNSSDIIDEREEYLKELSQVAGVKVHYTENNSAQVRLGNRLLVDNNKSYELEAVQESLEEYGVHFKGSTVKLSVKEGELSGLLNLQNEVVPEYQDKLDTLAENFGLKVNQIHSIGTGKNGGIESITSEEDAQDPNATLDSQGFDIKNGKFTINLRDKNNESISSFDINIDPSADSLKSVSDKIDGLANINSSITSSGGISISSDSGFDFSFSADTSNFLPELGVNTLFKGKVAKNFEVTNWVQDDGANLALGKDFSSGNNENALELINAVEKTAHDELNGMTFSDFHSSSITKIGNESKSKEDEVSLQTHVVDNLKEMRESISGVSIDEEIIKLNKYQYAYQASARLFQTVDELMQTTINLGQ